jgi:hypothetical protein
VPGHVKVIVEDMVQFPSVMRGLDVCEDGRVRRGQERSEGARCSVLAGMELVSSSKAQFVDRGRPGASVQAPSTGEGTSDVTAPAH